MNLNKHGHFWIYCDHCREPAVICGNCGNSCCNGGSGEYDDGSVCATCDDAYAFQAREEIVLTAMADRPVPPNPHRYWRLGLGL